MFAKIIDRFDVGRGSVFKVNYRLAGSSIVTCCPFAIMRSMKRWGDRAISANYGPIWIIHSHGTGKLKEGVHAYLKRHDRIAKFEPAEKYDGGAGVTVAYPK